LIGILMVDLCTPLFYTAKILLFGNLMNMLDGRDKNNGARE